MAQYKITLTRRVSYQEVLTFNIEGDSEDDTKAAVRKFPYYNEGPRFARDSSDWLKIDGETCGPVESIRSERIE